MRKTLYKFVKESNSIEGIDRGPSKAELKAHETFFNLPIITVHTIETLLGVLQPNAQLRNRKGLDVRVGMYMPPAGGPDIEERLRKLLNDSLIRTDPWYAHCCYESLHPFTDGNGRSGRALWAWGMLQGNDVAPLRYGFLQMFYYQTLFSHKKR